MIPAKLILFEGLPGSGKSTTAQQCCLHLNQCGIPTVWIYEQHVPHPIYADMDLAGANPHDARKVAALREQVLINWRALAARLAEDPRVHLLESAFFQTQITLYQALGMPDEEIVATLVEVERTLASVGSALILFRQQDVGKAIRKMLHQRGPDFEKYLIEQINATLALRDAPQIENTAGLIFCFEVAQRLVDRVVAALTMRKLSIENSAGDWQMYRRAITDFLEVPSMKPDTPPSPALNRMVATYLRLDSTDEFIVGADEQGLFLQEPKNRIIQQTDSLFHVAAMPVELHFEFDAAGAARTVTVTGPLTDLPQTWQRR